MKKQLDGTSKYVYEFYNVGYCSDPRLNDKNGLATYNRITGSNFKCMSDAKEATEECTFMVNVALVLLEIGCKKAQKKDDSFGLVRILRRYEGMFYLDDFNYWEVCGEMVLRKRLEDHFKNAPDHILTESEYHELLAVQDDQLEYIDLP